MRNWIQPVLVLLVISTGIYFNGCKHEPVEPIDREDPLDTANNNDPDTTGNDTTIIKDPCDPDSVYFENEILPLLQSSCAKSGCHDPGTAQKGVVLNNYQNIMTTGEVVPGNPFDSEIYEKMTDPDLDDRMPPPPNAPLTSEQLQTIRNWISQGARNNKCTSGCDTTDVKLSGHILPTINTYCKNCHNATVTNGGVRLDSYTEIRKVALNGRLYGAVSHDPDYTNMPYNGNKLSDCKILQIRKWIEAGAPNN